MRVACLLALAVSLVFSALPAAHAAGEAEAAVKPLSAWFPEKTLIYVEVPSAPAFVEGAKGTGLYALWNDDSMRAARGWLEEGNARPGDETDPRVRDMRAVWSFLSSVSGGVALGLEPIGPQVDWLLVAETADEAAAGTFIDYVKGVGAGAAQEAEIAGVQATILADGVTCAAVVDSVTVVGTRGPVEFALLSRTAPTRTGSLSANVDFVKASTFRSGTTPALRGVLAFPRLWASVKPTITAKVPLDMRKIFGMFDVDGIETVSMEASFAQMGMVEHIYISTRTAESPLIDLIGREPFDEARLAVAPRSALFAAGRAADYTLGYKTTMELLAALKSVSNVDFEGMLRTSEKKTGISVERDILPALGANSVTYFDLPAHFTLASMTPGGFGDQVSLIEVTDEAAIAAAVEKFVAVAANDATILDAMAVPGQAPPKIQVSTLGNLKIYYLMLPGNPLSTPALAVSNGYLIYSNNKESVKAVIDRLIAPGLSLAETNDYLRVRGALGGPAAQVGYVNMDRVIEILYDAVLPMAAPWLDAAHKNGESPLAAADIPPAYVVKKYVDGFGMTASASGNLVDLQVYGPFGGATAAALGAAVLPALSYLHNGGAAGTFAAAEDANPSRRQLVQIGRQLQLASIELTGRFPERLDQAMPRSLLQSPADPADDSQVDYVYVPGYTTSSPGNRVLVYERKGLNPDGRYVLYVDGRVEFVNEADFEKLINEAGQGQAGR